MELISILKSLQNKIGKFSVIGGSAFVIQTNSNKKPKDIDIVIGKEISSDEIENCGITNYSLYQSSFDDEGIVSDFEFRGFNVQLVYPQYNEWNFYKDFEFEIISGIRVATLESVISNTLKKKIKNYVNLPLLMNWSGIQFAKFLKEIENKENSKELLLELFIKFLNDKDFDQFSEYIGDFKIENLSRNKIFLNLYKRIKT